MKQDNLELLNTIAQIIYDKKGFNILALDVREVSSITDFFIIAEGNVDRHVKSMSNAVSVALKEMGEHPTYVEGQQTGDWVVLDYLGIIVHLFMPGMREKYSLEQVWDNGKVVDLNIQTEATSK